jgi:hypothetical protein
MPTIQELANDLHSLLTASGCDRKGDVAERAMTLATQFSLTSPSWSGFSNEASPGNPPVPPIKDPPDDPEHLECAVRVGYEMLTCYLQCLSQPNPQLCVDGCEATYCEDYEECVGA